ncbi:M23 family metallopeptidase [bacterium]|nr:MAG: M23 family metallopeptidase [bacterium]
MTPEERWAYDLAVVPYSSKSANLADYGCYGIPVVAPAAGVVVEIHDGEPDQTPGVLVKNPVNPGGNWIAIQLDETGTFLILAHLKPDRMMVSAGDHVSEGQELGRCGNSGNSSEPHIHIHHQRENPRVTARGWAEGLPLYFRDLDGDAMPQGGLDGGIVQHIGANE